jgi:hypothetical protein
MDVLQTLGVAYLALMLYLSFLYYKRNNYSLRSFIFWACVWAVGIVLLVIPQTTSVLTQRLRVPRVIDFYLILGLMFFSIICFLSYAAVRRNEAKIEELVRSVAIERAKKGKK